MTKRVIQNAAAIVAAAVLCVAGIGGCADSKAEGKSEGDEQKLELSQVPAAVRETLNKEAGGAKIEKVDKETDDGKTVYETDVTINGKNYEIKVAEDGSLISKKLDNEEEEHAEKGEGKHEKDEADEKDEKDEKNEKGEKSGAAAEAVEPGEVKVKLDETPAAVRATIQRELAGGELEDIAKKKSDGKTVYETDIIRGGKKFEVLVAEDGSVIHKLEEGSAAEQAADKAEEAKATVGPAAEGFRDQFQVSKAALKATGDNSYLAVQPGRVLKLTDGKDTLTITILPETKTVDGVACGILEEKETKDGKLIEISRNFFATDPATKDVYYFGEDVDNYKDGKIINHESAWLSGQGGARFGLMVPGAPKVGDKFYQEIAPKVALDRVEVVSTDESVKTPAGTFEHCLHLKESTPLEPDVSHKYFAPGIGMIKDDDFELAEKP